MRTRQAKAVALPLRKSIFTRFQKRIIILGCVILAVISLILLFNVTSSAENTHTVETCYTNVLVNDGDSLWSIANDNYNVEYGSFDKYLSEIRTLNHLGDNKIHAGEYLVIPVSR